MLRRGWALWGTFVVVTATVAFAFTTRGGNGGATPQLVRRAGESTPASSSTTAGRASEVVAAPAVTSTTAAPAPPPPPPPSPPQPAPGTAVYRGLGTWVDVYDWSVTFSKHDPPPLGVGDIDAMAAAGIQTLFIQTAKWDAPGEILEPDRLLPLIQRARAQGLSVVGWYLPSLLDPPADLAKLMATARLGLDGIAVDIEARKVADVGERNRRLLALSSEVRRALPGQVIGAIPYPPVLLDVINPKLWPGFPWRELAPFYDVWLPMSYQSFRDARTGYRDAYRYTAENIDRMRAHLGWLDAPVHPIGGIADRTGPADVAAMLRAASERGALGGSLYDWRTTSAALWPHLHGFRAPR